MLASRAVNRPSARPATDVTPTALRWVLGALVVFALNLGGFGITVVRDVNKTDEAAYEAGSQGAQAEWSSAAPGDDSPDEPLRHAAVPVPAPIARQPEFPAPAAPALAEFRRGASARAPPVSA